MLFFVDYQKFRYLAAIVYITAFGNTKITSFFQNYGKKIMSDHISIVTNHVRLKFQLKSVFEILSLPNHSPYKLGSPHTSSLLSTNSYLTNTKRKTVQMLSKVSLLSLAALAPWAFAQGDGGASGARTRISSTSTTTSVSIISPPPLTPSSSTSRNVTSVTTVTSNSTIGIPPLLTCFVL